MILIHFDAGANNRLLKLDRKQLEYKCKQAMGTVYYCHADAQAVGEKLIGKSASGCFVLLTNLLDRQSDWPARELLSLYKSRIGIKKNFSFLKDPAIVNSIFRTPYLQETQLNLFHSDWLTFWHTYCFEVSGKHLMKLN